jgi:type IV secretory pathway TrbF-like protein
MMKKILIIVGILLLLMGGCTYGVYKLAESQLTGLVDVATQLGDVQNVTTEEAFQQKMEQVRALYEENKAVIDEIAKQMPEAAVVTELMNVSSLAEFQEKVGVDGFAKIQEALNTCNESLIECATLLAQ